MISMQYKIVFPNDYDMDKIRDRIKQNGNKTDGFNDLFCKLYLISDLSMGTTKEYSPLYLWKSHDGMNRFIFDGFYDNILNSFGWQNINISIPYDLDLVNINEAKYLLEIENKIDKTENMNKLNYSQDFESAIGKMIVYNPDEWKYVEYYFFKTKPSSKEYQIYQILHISSDDKK